MNILEVKNLLKKEVFEKKYVNIGYGAEKCFGVNRVKFSVAVTDMSKAEGYEIFYIKHPIVPEGDLIKTIKVLSAPGTKYEEVYIHQGEIQEPASYI